MQLQLGYRIDLISTKRRKLEGMCTYLDKLKDHLHKQEKEYLQNWQVSVHESHVWAHLVTMYVQPQFMLVFDLCNMLWMCNRCKIFEWRYYGFKLFVSYKAAVVLVYNLCISLYLDNCIQTSQFRRQLSSKLLALNISPLHWSGTSLAALLS